MKLLYTSLILALTASASYGQNTRFEPVSKPLSQVLEHQETRVLPNDTSQVVGPEVHVIGIYETEVSSMEGSRPGQTIVLDSEPSSVPVVVDRPGQEVHLVLTSYDAVVWDVEVTPGTIILDVSVMSHKPGSFAMVGPVKFVKSDELQRLAHKQDSERFYPYHNELLKKIEADKMSSFTGIYRAPSKGFYISNADGVPTEKEKWSMMYGKGVKASSLPISFQQRLASSRPQAMFDYSGFAIEDERGLQKFAIPESADLSWPEMSAAYDPQRGVVWGVSSHVFSYLYRYNIQENEWVKHSLGRGVSFGGIHYDDDSSQLYTIDLKHSASEATLSVFNVDTFEVVEEYKMALDMESLTTLYDPGNGPSPIFDVWDVQGELVLVRARKKHSRAGEPTLFYLFDKNGSNQTLLVDVSN